MIKTKLLILLKSIDGGTGTYLQGILELKKIYPKSFDIKVLVLDKTRFRKFKDKNFFYFASPLVDESYGFNIKTIKIVANEVDWLKKHIKSFRPDIVLASNTHSILISEICKLISKAEYRTVSLIQNNLSKVLAYKTSRNFSPFIKYFLSVLLRKSDKVVTVSKDLSKDIHIDLHLKKLPITISAMLPGVNTDNIHPSLSQKTILTIARLDEQKDNETLLKAFRIVKNRIPDSKLIIAGDGGLKYVLKKMAHKLGISDSTKFMGWVQNPEKLFNKCSIFVLSSKWEGFPLSLIEAMNYGVPVIASDCHYGPSEILKNNRYGLLFDVGDTEGLASKIIDLLSNPVRYEKYSRMSKIRSMDYSQQKMLHKFKKLVDSFKS